MSSTIERILTSVDHEVPLPERTDEALLLAYREEDNREAFQCLVRRYERELYSYLRRYLGNAEMAEDAFQMTFFQVHLKCHQFDAERKVRPWLYTVATNQAIDAQRRNRRHCMASLDARGGGPASESGGIGKGLLVDGVSHPLDRLQDSEQEAQVRRAVDELPESLRQVVLLVYYQGIKYREAAEVLSIPVGTVKSRLHTAVLRLTDMLTPTRDSSHE